MELVITEKPTICLNMIVKDEHHIIVKTLEMLCSKIAFSYWVICDTGSTDNTKELIVEFFKMKGIAGELHTHKWTNFAHNRTLALDAAFKKSDLILIFDADDEIHGTIKMPESVDADGYHLHFGDPSGTAYSRVLLVNNRIKWNYQSVIHEYINCLTPNPVLKHIDGDYYLISGRTGNRSLDPQKYLKDAKVLEEAHSVALLKKDPLHLRYAFYCANSYKDYGSHEEAIKWYKITLGQENWIQEKFMCCYNLFNCYKKMEKHEESFFWAVQASKYDEERIECLFELVQHYIINGMEKIAYNYYRIFKPFYETKYLQSKMEDKLFIENEKYNLLLPYFMILVGDKCKGEYPEAAVTIAKMYEIIFTKKFPSTSMHFIGNMLYNLTLFIDLCITCIPNFILLFKEYVLFLESIKYPFEKHDGFFQKFEKYGVTLSTTTLQTIVNQNVLPLTKFSLLECKASNKILFYTGFANVPWNYSYSMNNALGGSETAAAYLSKAFPSWYDIYVGGAVAEEKVDNITYINFDTMNKMLRENPFHTVIVSRYIGFYEMFPDISFYQSFIWAHDIILYPYGSSLDETTLLNKWSKKITGCICQTEWHTNRFKELYPSLRDKMHTINNGLITDLFVKKPVKVPNRFIYTSCTERGLSKLLELWPKILEEMPDAELVVSCYNAFPQNDDEHRMNGIIQKYSSSIKHLGSLKREKLYELMATAEYWLYPSHFPETSCITSMELLMSEVVCFYYPEAGLVNTIGSYGIPMVEGAELDGLFSLTNKKKSELKRLGKEYALSCSWANRAANWSTVLNLNLLDSVKEQVEPEKKEQDKKIVSKIKVINLLKREDRKQNMIKHFNNASVEPDSYEFCEAINGQDLKESEELRLLFEQNNFGYKKGVIGCALSHLKLWKQLTNDSNNEFYVVLEDDLELLPDFKTNLEKYSKIFVEQGLEHLSLGVIDCNNEEQSKIHDPVNIKIFEKDVYKFWNLTFAYIISKKAAAKMIAFINNCSIKCAFDNPQSFGEVVSFYHTSCCIVKQLNIDSDIQHNSNAFSFVNANVNTPLRIAFCDWWETEYCGGTFDANSNFITDILRKYGSKKEVTIVSQNDNPDVLFYSIFGNAHPHVKAGRKVFFSGEPFPARQDANFNFTFDKNSENNVRFPLWLGYLNDYLLEENERRKNGLTAVPIRDKFCSFISNGEVKTTHRRTFVEKLSAYKKVDCGGQFLNNIGFVVPRGVNCSGKIEHNNNYKFAIAFENEDYPGYVTEKICDIYKSNCVPIYWGTTHVVKDFNPTTFINARDFITFDELVEYVIKVDNDDILYASYFKEPFFSNKWLDAFNDPNKTFYKNLADCIIGKQQNLVDNYFLTIDKIDKAKEKWVIYGPGWVFNLIKDFVNNLSLTYDISYVTTSVEIQNINPSKILCINNVHDDTIFKTFKHMEISILNIDSLYLSYFLNNIYSQTNLYPKIKIYDYSLSNIKILKEHNINCQYLEYIYDEKEVSFLREINKQPKIYDFGIICYNKDCSFNKRRKYIFDLLKQHGFTVNVACGFDKERDIELGKCNIILNIHQQHFENNACLTFEHLRCNRLLNAGFNILSEVSYVDNVFVEKYPNLKFINYLDFENITKENMFSFEYIKSCQLLTSPPKPALQIFNIWHNKLFDKCYDKLDAYSLNKITMFDVNPNYEKIYNSGKGYKIVKEYDLSHYNSLYQVTNYCQTSCLYHVFKNALHITGDYIGFIQYDMDLASDFIYDIEKHINVKNDVESTVLHNNIKFFYSLEVENKIDVPLICQPYDNSILEKYNSYFNTNHTYQSIKTNKKSCHFICLHTFVIPTKIFIKMMTWYCTITDWLHTNYINGLYCESMSEVTEEIFGLFLLLQMIENESIELVQLKLWHEWPNLHNETAFNNYKEGKPHYSLDKIVNNKTEKTTYLTDKSTCHSYLETYETLLKGKQLSCKNVLEIGVQFGGSIKLWNDYFVNAQIYGIDIDAQPQFLKEYKRCHHLIINAYSQESIDYFIDKNVKFDLILDDGPHSLESMVYFVQHYTKLLADDGILIVEDIPDINWCNILIDNIDESLKQYIEIYDLRHIKNRWDDILLVINKTSNIKQDNPKSIFKIEYGITDCRIDVTQDVIDKCSYNSDNTIFIPQLDYERAQLFSDPMFGSRKSIFINNIEYVDDANPIYLNLVDGSVTFVDPIRIKEEEPDTTNQASEIIVEPEIFLSEYKILKPQYNFAVLAIFKNETMVLKTWLEHYLWQGVNHFYLIDNGSTDEPLSILQSYIDQGLVTYYYRPERFMQAQHYSAIFDLENLKETCKWLCICDLDEFFFGTEQQLAKEIETFDKYDIIYTNSFFYGSDGLINQPDDIRTSIVHREADVENGIKYIFKPSSISSSSEIWLHWLVKPGTLQKKHGQNEIFDNSKIRLNHYRIQSLEYFQEVKMTRGDCDIEEHNNMRTMEYFNKYTLAATIRDDILKRIIETNYLKPEINVINTTVNTAVIVEPRFLKYLPFVINDFNKKLGKTWKIVFYCGTNLKNIWIDLLNNDNIEIRELNTNYYKNNEYSDFLKSKELWETLYGEYVLIFSANSIILNEAPYTIDYFMGLNKSYIGGNQCYRCPELVRDNIHFSYYNCQGGLSLRKRNDMIKIIDTFKPEKTSEGYNQSKKLQSDVEECYFTIGAYKLGLPIGDDEICSHFSVHTMIKDKFFGAYRIEYGYYTNLIQKYDNFCDNIYMCKSIDDIDNDVLRLHPGGGLFSNCTLRLFDIVLYFNATKTCPIIIDGSSQFNLYKAGTGLNDLSQEYFTHKIETGVNESIFYENPIDFREQYQYIDYKKLDFKGLNPFVKKYFSPSPSILETIKFIENKYNVINKGFNNICVLFYRGNDKITEYNLPSYDDIVKEARVVQNKTPGIQFLLQSDEKEFIERMLKEFPTNSFYFKDEIRVINKNNNTTVDKINEFTNFLYSQYYLAITKIMSKCKYVVCNTGNCSLWITLFRGNADNVVQVDKVDKIKTNITDFLNKNGLRPVEGYSQQILQQVADLVSLTTNPNINVMEIGFNAGHSAEVFLENNDSLLLTSFDLGEHNYVLPAKEYIDKTYPTRHKLILGDSRITVPKFISENNHTKFDVIFIDGGHDYEIAKTDMQNCLQLAHKDTILILDDTMFAPEWVRDWTIGPTRTWTEHLMNNKITETKRSDYEPGRGMSWGKYTF